MNEDNICAFISKEDSLSNHSLSILNMVYERHPELIYSSFRIRSCYSFNIVVNGSGKLKTLYKEYDLKENDFFITYPSTSYKIETNGDLQFIFISFIGTILLSIADQLIINNNNPIIHFKDTEITNYYQNTIMKLTKETSTYLSLSAFYFTLAKLTAPISSPKHNESSVAMYIKNYIEEHYAEPDLKLEKIATNLNYHQNYLSGIFKREFNVTFSTYLQNIRLSNSIHLINNGLTSVKEIAHLCGFEDALYFSRVFKKANGISPKTIIKNKNSLYKLK